MANDLPGFPKLKQGFGSDRYKKDPNVDVREYAREQGRKGGKAAQAKGTGHRFEGKSAEENGRKGAQIRWAAWRLAKAAFEQTVIGGMSRRLDPNYDPTKDEEKALAEAVARAKETLQRSEVEYRRLQKTPQKRIDELSDIVMNKARATGSMPNQPPMKGQGAVPSVDEVIKETEAIVPFMPNDRPVSTGNRKADDALDSLTNILLGIDEP